MRRSFLGSLLSSALLFMATGPALACLWDRELQGHEKEFKSSYLEQSSQEPPGDQVRGDTRPEVGLLVGAAGAVLLMSGLFIGLVRGVSRSTRERLEDER